MSGDRSIRKVGRTRTGFFRLFLDRKPEDLSVRCFWIHKMRQDSESLSFLLVWISWCIFWNQEQIVSGNCTFEFPSSSPTPKIFTIFLHLLNSDNMQIWWRRHNIDDTLMMMIHFLFIFLSLSLHFWPGLFMQCHVQWNREKRRQTIWFRFVNILGNKRIGDGVSSLFTFFSR